MAIFVTLHINGGPIKDQVVQVSPGEPLIFKWENPRKVNKEAFDLLLQECEYFNDHIALPNLRWADVTFDEDIDENSSNALDAVVMAQILNVLWWLGKQRGIAVKKTALSGIKFRFKALNFSVDEYIR